METTTGYYTATAHGQRILTVIATSREAARAQIVEQLACRPGRMGYYHWWQEDGEQIEPRLSPLPNHLYAETRRPA